MINFINAEWPAPKNVHAFTTTRQGGHSQGAFASLNLSNTIDDVPEHVSANRFDLKQELALPSDPYWLKQIHGTRIIDASTPYEFIEADASFSTQTGKVCAVLTADCLPLLICNQRGTVCAAVHAGWQGIAAGVIESAFTKLREFDEQWLVWLGPTISVSAFEVGPEVREKFIRGDAIAEQAFKPGKEDRWYADIRLLAKQRLAKCDIDNNNIYQCEHCTYRDEEQFFSYRRDQQTGRMVSLIWLD